MARDVAAPPPPPKGVTALKKQHLFLFFLISPPVQSSTHVVAPISRGVTDSVAHTALSNLWLSSSASALQLGLSIPPQSTLSIFKLFFTTLPLLLSFRRFHLDLQPPSPLDLPSLLPYDQLWLPFILSVSSLRPALEGFSMATRQMKRSAAHLPIPTLHINMTGHSSFWIRSICR